MGDNDNSGLVIGIIIGTFIALVLFSRNTQTIYTQTTHEQHNQQSSQQPQEYNWQPIDIPRVDDIKPQQIIQPLQQDPDLQMTPSQLELVTSKLKELQDSISKLKQDTMYQPHIFVQPEPQPQIIIQQIPQPQEPQPQITVQPIVTQPIQPTQPITPVEQIYKNSEKWKIVRSQNGRIKSLDIVRDVKKTS
jgi:hypothetical protein